MANKGRLYPLSIHRARSADAPYPRWMAERYTISLPAMTGTLAGDFPLLVETLGGVSNVTINGTEWGTTFFGQATGTSWSARLLQGWNNGPPAERIVAVELTGGGATVIWQGNEDPTFALDHFSIFGAPVVSNPALLNPAGFPELDAVPW